MPRPYMTQNRRRRKIMVKAMRATGQTLALGRRKTPRQGR